MRPIKKDMTEKYYDNFKQTAEGEIIAATSTGFTYRKLTKQQHEMFVKYLYEVKKICYRADKDDVALYNDEILCFRPFRKQKMRGIIKLNELIK
jgi:hypothetical protein